MTFARSLLVLAALGVLAARASSHAIDCTMITDCDECKGGLGATHCGWCSGNSTLPTPAPTLPSGPVCNLTLGVGMPCVCPPNHTALSFENLFAGVGSNNTNATCCDCDEVPLTPNCTSLCMPPTPSGQCLSLEQGPQFCAPENFLWLPEHSCDEPDVPPFEVVMEVCARGFLNETDSDFLCALRDIAGTPPTTVTFTRANCPPNVTIELRERVSDDGCVDVVGGRGSGPLLTANDTWTLAITEWETVYLYEASRNCENCTATLDFSSVEPPTPIGTVHVVVVGPDGELRYAPPSLTIAVGDQVEFRFESEGHSVTEGAPCVPLDLGGGGFDSGVLEAGDSFVVTFDTVATIPFFSLANCDVMIGEIVVGALPVEQIVLVGPLGEPVYEPAELQLPFGITLRWIWESDQRSVTEGCFYNCPAGVHPCTPANEYNGDYDYFGDSGLRDIGGDDFLFVFGPQDSGAVVEYFDRRSCAAWLIDNPPPADGGRRRRKKRQDFVGPDPVVGVIIVIPNPLIPTPVPTLPPTNCSDYTTCVSCQAAPGCGYCESLDRCLQGNDNGPTEPVFCPNWLWDSCPHVPCGEYQTCDRCTKDEFCGWCGTTGKCTEGDTEPLFGTCDDWRQGGLGVSCSCGNAIIEDGEECDDGNTINGDGCSNGCKIERCGDGIVNLAFEECDDGNIIDNDECSNACLSNCGNGFLDMFEECDDGNRDPADRCSNECTRNECGNGRIDYGEECDDANLDNVDECSNRCTANVCGNGRKDPGEECDDGNLDDNDMCDTNCRFNSEFTPETPAVCGNGVVESPEVCDGDDGLTDPATELCFECSRVLQRSESFGAILSDTGALVILSLDVPAKGPLPGFFDCALVLAPVTMNTKFAMPPVYMHPEDIAAGQVCNRTAAGELQGDCRPLGVDEPIGQYCYFADDETVIIFVGDDDRFDVGDPLNPSDCTVTVCTDDAVCPGIGDVWEIPTERDTASVLPPLNPVSPHVSLSGPSEVRCLAADQQFRIYGSGVTGSGGRPFLDPTPSWTVSASFEGDNFTQLVERVEATTITDYVELEASLFDENVVYTFSLTLLNRFRKQSTASFEMTYGKTSVDSATTPPNIRILGSRRFGVQADRDLTFLAVNYPPQYVCNAGTSESITQLAWSRVEGPLLVLDSVASVNPSISLLAGDDGPLTAPTSYTLQVDATRASPTTPIASEDVASARVSIDTRSADPIAVISGGHSRQSGRAVPLTLDASQSHDPDNEVGAAWSYVWSCSMESETGETIDCPVAEFLATQSTASVEVPPYNLPIGDFMFHVTVSRGSRSASASQAVEVVFRDVPLIGVDRQRQNGLPTSRLVNPSDLLVLATTAAAATEGVTRSGFSFMWESSLGMMPSEAFPSCLPCPNGADACLLSERTGCGQNLVIAAGALPPGKTMEFTVTGTDSEAEPASARASIMVTTNIAPASGRCVAERVRDRAVDGGFVENYVEVICTGWQVVFPENEPLLYSYEFCDPASDCTTSDERHIAGFLHASDLRVEDAMCSFGADGNTCVNSLVVYIADSMFTRTRRVVPIVDAAGGAKKRTVAHKAKRDALALTPELVAACESLDEAKEAHRSREQLTTTLKLIESLNRARTVTACEQTPGLPAQAALECSRLEQYLNDFVDFVNDDVQLPASSAAYQYEALLYRTLFFPTFGAADTRSFDTFATLTDASVVATNQRVCRSAVNGLLALTRYNNASRVYVPPQVLSWSVDIVDYCLRSAEFDDMLASAIVGPDLSAGSTSLLYATTAMALRSTPAAEYADATCWPDACRDEALWRGAMVDSQVAVSLRVEFTDRMLAQRQIGSSTSSGAGVPPQQVTVDVSPAALANDFAARGWATVESALITYGRLNPYAYDATSQAVNSLVIDFAYYNGGLSEEWVRDDGFSAPVNMTLPKLTPGLDGGVCQFWDEAGMWITDCVSVLPDCSSSPAEAGCDAQVTCACGHLTPFSTREAFNNRVASMGEGPGVAESLPPAEMEEESDDINPDWVVLTLFLVFLALLAALLAFLVYRRVRDGTEQSFEDKMAEEDDGPRDGMKVLRTGDGDIFDISSSDSDDAASLRIHKPMRTAGRIVFKTYSAAGSDTSDDGSGSMSRRSRGSVSSSGSSGSGSMSGSSGSGSGSSGSGSGSSGSGSASGSSGSGSD